MPFSKSLSDVTSFAQTSRCLAGSPRAHAYHLVILEILQQVFHCLKAGNFVAFCWLPGHTGFSGNEATDAAAKEAAVLGD
jgi:ribonuclease HI